MKEAARALGTSRARVDRAARRHGIGTWRSSRMRFSSKNLDRLASILGRTPEIPGLSRVESLVLAELLRRPWGFISAREAASRCSISPTSASKAIKSLTERGLIRHERAVVARGRARPVTQIRANLRHPDWSELAPKLAHVHAPRQNETPPTQVPPGFEHAFWNLDHSQYRRLRLEKDGSFIANRALTVNDLRLLAFAAQHLPKRAWSDAARQRGLSPEQRHTALTLAGECV